MFYFGVVVVVVIVGVYVGYLVFYFVVVVGMVVLGGGIELGVLIFVVGEVDFIEQVDVVGDDIVLVEFVVGFVVVGVVYDVLVLVFGMYVQGVVDGVVLVQVIVGIGQVDGGGVDCFVIVYQYQYQCFGYDFWLMLFDCIVYLQYFQFLLLFCI